MQSLLGLSSLMLVLVSYRSDMKTSITSRSTITTDNQWCEKTDAYATTQARGDQGFVKRAFRRFAASCDDATLAALSMVRSLPAVLRFRLRRTTEMPFCIAQASKDTAMRRERMLSASALGSGFY